MIKFAKSLTALTLLFCISAAQAEEEPIRIAIAGPVTGPLASEGADMIAGARAAAKHINKNGGILGRNLEIVAADDRGSPQDAINAANKIVADGIQYVVGHYRSSDTKPASAVYDESGIVHITPSQDPALMQQNFERFFRINPNAERLAKAYFDLVVEEISKEKHKVAIIGNNSEYSQSIAQSLKTLLSERSIKPAYEGYYTPDETDYAAIITKMKFEGISLVLIAGSQKEMGFIVRQSADHGFTPEFALSSTAASSGFAAITGCSGVGVKVVAARNPLYFAGNETIAAALRAEEADGLDMAINTYSAITALALAIDKAGKDDAGAVSDILHKNSFDLPIGSIQFTASGEFVGAAPIVYEYQGVNCPNGYIRMAPATP